MKPTIIYLLFGSILGVGLLRGRSYLRLVMEEVVPLEHEGWMILTRRVTAFFFALAVLNEVIWRTMCTEAWVDLQDLRPDRGDLRVLHDPGAGVSRLRDRGQRRRLNRRASALALGHNGLRGAGACAASGEGLSALALPEDIFKRKMGGRSCAASSGRRCADAGGAGEGRARAPARPGA